MADKQTPGVNGAPLPAEDEYKPSFLEKTTGIRFPGLSPFVSSDPGSLHRRMQYETVQVWSDMQGKLVSAGEYLRETEPVEMEVIEQVADAVAQDTSKVVKKNLGRKYGESAARKVFLDNTVKRTPVVGKILGKTIGELWGLDVTTMGDATIDGARYRAQKEIRQEYDQLAIHMKRQEVQAAVNGRPYEPNFLMGIANLRRITDGFQDFTPKIGDSTLVHKQSMDESEAGDVYRQPALWMNGAKPPSDLDKQYKQRAANLGVTKMTRNYDPRKDTVPVA